MECIEIKDPKKLVMYCSIEDEATKSQLFRCFFKLFYNHFKYIFHGYCDLKSSMFTTEEQLRTAFNHGLCIFYKDLCKKGWNERGATVKTALFTYCRYQLLYLARYLRKHSSKQAPGDIMMLTDKKKDSIEVQEEKDFRDYEIKLFNKAFEKLNKRCQTLILLQKVDKLENAAIAQRVNKLHGTKLTAGSVNNEVYKCSEKLKKIVADLKEGK